MSYSKDPTRYPDEYQQMFRDANKKKITLDCLEESSAISLNHKLNSYRRAMEISKTVGYLECARITIRRKGHILILENKSNTIEEILKRSNVSLTSTEPTEAEIEERLRQMGDSDESS